MWRDPTWITEAIAWIDARVERTGEVEQPHVQPWSTAMRVPVHHGAVWFKASRDAFEARLTPLLASLRPDVTVEVLATDGDRGWMLTRDAGVRLREAAEGPALDRWEELLPRYAELQAELAPRVDELLSLGVPDHRLAVLPSQPRSAVPGFDELCARLAAFGVPDTLQHDDFNDGNVFVRGGGYVFFDWGDACVSHPFHTLVVTLRALAHRYELVPGGAEVLRLRDAYLEPWTRLLPRDELLAAADLARRTGTVQRAMAWQRYADAMPPGEREEYEEDVAYGFRLYAQDPPWGAWNDGTL